MNIESPRPSRLGGESISENSRVLIVCTTGWRLGALLLLITLVAYLPALRAGFIWDDDDYVENNLTLRSVHGLSQIWFQPITLPQYYPLVHTTFWVEYQLWGLNSFGYHLDNILLHAITAWLLGILLKRLNLPGAALAAMIFAVHPVHVESVAWITERKNVLSGLLYFASAILFWDFIARPPRHWRYAASLGCFVLALLAKTVTCSLPAAMLLVIWWKRRNIVARFTRTSDDLFTVGRKNPAPALAIHAATMARLLGLLAPFFVLGAAFAITTATFERRIVGAVGPEFDLSGIDRLLIASRAIWFYFSKLILPAELAFIYPRWHVPAPAWVWGYFASALLLVLGLWLLRNRVGRGPLIAMLLFGGTLLPALGFINVYPMRYSFIADHFQYLASAGMIAFLCAVLHRLLGSWSLILVPTLITATFFQSQIYRNRLTLWRDVLDKNPDAWLAHTNLALELSKEPATIVQAMSHYQRAVEIAQHLPDTHHLLGRAYAATGRLEDASACFDRALAIDPRFAPAWVSKGRLALGREDFASAEQHFRHALELNRYTFAAYSGLAVTLDRLGRRPEAVEVYEALLAVEPNNLQALYDLGTWAMESNDLTSALSHLGRVVTLEPAWVEARVNFGAALLRDNRPAYALEQFEAALRDRPGFGPALSGAQSARAQSDRQPW